MTIKDLNQRRTSLIGVIFEPGKETADRFDLSLDMKECASLGYAVAHWSLLEEALLRATLGIADQIGITPPADVRQDSFRRRLAAFRSVIEQIPSQPAREYHMKIYSQIANENGVRQRLVHGMWSYDVVDPDFLIVDKSGKDSGGPQLLNTDYMVAFAHRVGRLVLALLYPNGLTIEQVSELRQNGPSFSRRGLRMLMGRELPD